MKKLLFIACLSVLGTSSFAQGITGGIKAGLNIANQKVSGDGVNGTPSSVARFHGGAYLTIMFNEHIGLQPELLYSSQGAKFTFPTDSNYIFIKLDYISIPLLFRYNVNDLISFHAGPQIGFLTSAKGTTGISSPEDIFKGTDVGLVVGGTVDLTVGLNFTFRYIGGLSNVTTVRDVTAKNNSIQISVGYKIFGDK